MSAKSLRLRRLGAEMRNFATRPPTGISCRPRVDDVYDVLDAVVKGPEGTPYESGTFKLEIHIPDNYPLEPPHVKFITEIRHPNIDKSGRICMDMLKMQPKGTWGPTTSLETLLVSIQTLLSEPNAEDPLMLDIATEFKLDYETFLKRTRAHTEEHAKLDK